MKNPVKCKVYKNGSKEQRLTPPSHSFHFLRSSQFADVRGSIFFFSHYQLLKAEKESRIQKYYFKLLLSAKRKTLAEKGETIIIGERVLLGIR